ncbi:MAG: zf-HC2 domain-containing protein [bacterium]
MTGNHNACIGDDLLWRYIEKDTDDREDRMVRNHIIRCSACFSIVASVLYNEKHPFTAEEMAEVDKLLSKNREKLIDDFLHDYRKSEGISTNESKDTNALNRTYKESFLDKIADWVNNTRFVRPAVGVAFIIFIAVVGWQIFIDKPDRITNQYVYDDRAPFLPSGLRSAGPVAEFANWREMLNDAIINKYAMQGYENAISAFEAIEPIIQTLPPDSMTNQVISRLRDIHFYKGLSHFALSRSRVQNLTEQEKALQTQKAIQSLSAADSLVTAHNLPNSDREAFYLGLVLGLKGEIKNAIEKLNAVPEDSRFYEESSRLVKNWSDE